MNERHLLEETISENIIPLIKRKGQLSIMQTLEDKLYVSNIVHDCCYNIFTAVEDFITQHPHDYVEFLSGEFEIIRNTYLPLFAILDLTLLISNSTNIVMCQQDFEKFNAMIDRARELRFSDKFKKDWHINPKLAEYTGPDTTYSFLTNRRISPRNRNNEYVNWHYNTIDTFNNLLLGTFIDVPEGDILKIENSDMLNYDFSKYPDLICGEIMYVLIKNTRYEWGTWAPIPEQPHQIILFEEQQIELEQKYKQLQQLIDEAKRIAIIAELEKEVFPYYQDKSFQEFVLVDNISWEASKESKKMASGLELIFHIIKEVCSETSLPLTEVLKDSNLVKRFDGLKGFVSTPAYFYKQELLEILAEAYEKRAGMSKLFFGRTSLNKNAFQTKLSKLSLFDLDNLVNNVRTKTFGVRYLARIIHEEF